MLEFLAHNYGTIIVAVILAVAVALVLGKYIKDKKAGKSSCNCGCQGCPNAQYCHRNDGCGRYRTDNTKQH